MNQANSISTPMISNVQLSKYKGEAIQNDKQYRIIVGALQYATVNRPYIIYSVNKVSQFMQSSTDIHWKTVKRILRYLNGTLDFGLTLKTSKVITINGYADAD